MGVTGILIVSMVLLTLTRCQDLRLFAEPSNVVNGSTETLKITCKAPKLDESVNFIVLLQLDHVDVNTTTSVASERPDGTIVHRKNDRIKAEGKLKGEDGAYLVVTIASPEFSDTGKYQCRFANVNYFLFQFVILNKTIDVTFTEPDEPTPAPVVPQDCSCQEVWDEVKDLRATVLAENRELREKLRSYNDSCRVSFTAQLSSRLDTVFKSNHPVIFDSTVTNKGHAYNATKGIFIAPCNGQYYFSLTLSTNQEDDAGYVDGAIEVNGEEAARTRAFSVDHLDHFEQVSNGLVLSLEKGDEVQVRIQTNSDGHIFGEVFSIFSGFFISP